MAIKDRIIYRGVVGNWRHAGRRAVFGGTYLLIGIGIFAFIIWGIINSIEGISVVSVFMIMWILALGDAMREINITISWIVDDNNPADVY